ncbi:MAG: virulence RhuM family protein [Prevotella sp.]|nr:virulence RhuM family protein [Prevotella sp.]
MANEIHPQTVQQGEIILYQPDETVRLEVRLEDDTVWLTQAQMAELFQTSKNNITLHIGNVYKEKELSMISTSKESLLVQMEGNRQVTRKRNLYNLDVIISVGYRVKSLRGTQFRQWANKVIKEYMLRGYAFNQRLLQMEQRIDARLDAHTQTEQKRFLQIESTLADHQEKIDFFVRTNQPPVEGIFYDGQIFDAHRFVSELVRKAKHRIILIDNYVDESVLTQLDKRTGGVSATIYTQHISQQFQQDIDRHNAQYPPIVVEHFNRAHDRFLLIDDEVYHIGASLKDLGKKWFAFTLMHDLTATELIGRIGGSTEVNIE